MRIPAYVDLDDGFALLVKRGREVKARKLVYLCKGRGDGPHPRLEDHSHG
jgi:hypothetical protein